MAIHPSLGSSAKTEKQRSVLTRIERLRIMLEKGEWKEEDDVYGLPKIKTVRIKIKKEKAAEKPEEATVAEGAAPTGTETPAKGPATGPATKTQAQDKKSQDKK